MMDWLRLWAVVTGGAAAVGAAFGFGLVLAWQSVLALAHG